MKSIYISGNDNYLMIYSFVFSLFIQEISKYYFCDKYGVSEDFPRRSSFLIALYC